MIIIGCPGRPKLPTVKDQPLVYIGIAQTIIFAFQLFVFSRQAKRLRQTVEGAKEQSGEMKRAADAMQISSKAATIASQAAAESVIAVRERTAQQMRAYLCVNNYIAVYQEREKGIRFESKPMLLNTGHTPAYNVTYKAKADILPYPLPKDFSLPSLDDRTGYTAGVLGPQQNFILNAWVEGDFFEDGEAEEIKRGRGRRLCIWGTVTYEDIFGEKKYTNFFQSIWWAATEQGDRVIGNYESQHSDAN